eukprot:gene3711-4060_t
MSGAPVSIKDRIAALKAKETAAAAPPAIPVKKEEDGASSSSSSATRRPSIQERIACIKAQTASKSEQVVTNTSSSSAATTPTHTASDSAAAVSPLGKEKEDKGVEDPQDERKAIPPSSKGGSIADRIAALKTSSAAAGPSPIKIGLPFQPVPPPPPPPIHHPQESLPVKNPSVAPETEVPLSAQSGAASEQSSSTAGAPVSRRGSIADRIAALKSAPGGAGGIPLPAVAGPGGPTGRRLSVERTAFANTLNLAALQPGGPRNSVVSFQDSSEETCSSQSAGEAGEINHLNLSRAAVPSERRKRAVSSVRLSSDWQALASEDLAALTLTSGSLTLSSSAAAALSTTCAASPLGEIDEESDNGRDPLEGLEDDA